MNWFKKKIASKSTMPESFDIGKPKYNLNIIINKLEPYNELDSLLGIKNDFLMSLSDKYYSFNQMIAYSVLENIFPKELSISTKGYFISHQYENILTQSIRLNFNEPSNMDALIDWNKLFKYVKIPRIDENNPLMEQAMEQMKYLIKGHYEGWTLHGHFVNSGDLLTFEIDQEHNNLVRVQETYEASLSIEEYEKRFIERIKTKNRITKKYFF
jgi:hypothetical protein